MSKESNASLLEKNVKLTVTKPKRDSLLKLLPTMEAYLPGQYSKSALFKLGIDPYTLDINLENASRFRFNESMDRESWDLVERKVLHQSLVRRHRMSACLHPNLLC